MNRTTQWLSLVAGVLLFLYGIKRVYESGEWMLLILSALIIAFSVSILVKNRPTKP